MTINDWEILALLAKENNITRVAEIMFMSQPTLSYRLKKIEGEFGVPLFYRSRKGIILTPEGEKLMSYAGQMRKLYYQIREDFSKMSTEVQGQLRLGVTTAFANHLLPDILNKFCKKYPKVNMSIKSNKSSVIYNDLQNGEFNIAILRGEYAWQETKTLLCDEPVYIVSSVPVDLHKLPDLPQILVPQSGIYSDVINWWDENYSMRPSSILMEVHDMETSLHMVSKGIGWAFLPAIFVGRNEKALHCTPLFWKNGVQVTRRTWMMCRDAVSKTAIISAFSSFVTENLHQ